MRRAKLPRPAAVLLTVALALGGTAVTSGVIVSHAATLSRDAPLHAERTVAKATTLSADLNQRFGF